MQHLLILNMKKIFHRMNKISFYTYSLLLLWIQDEHDPSKTILFNQIYKHIYFSVDIYESIVFKITLCLKDINFISCII